MMQITRRQLLIALLSLPLVGCGFQLRGWQGDDVVSQAKMPFRQVLLSVMGTDGQLVAEFKRVLIGLGCQFVTDSSQAEIEIVLDETTQQTVVSAIGSYGEISARLYVMTQGIRIRQVGQDHWLVDTRLRRSREVDLSMSNYAGLGSERPLAIARESEEVVIDIRSRLVEAMTRLVQGLAPLSEPIRL